ncbi:Gfo/Idh/MocA family oxidoreductase [Paenibacillus sp. FSL R10-2734]|uniref:Gfo/Idh/MocA family protein n=1 Tax=Paenibacillus sp. FSL R10-2734 TaxID=2954691 RepID=UPI0030D831F3
MTKKITAALLGAGGRGAVAYAPYALRFPDEIEFVAVAEPDAERREKFVGLYNLSEENTFLTWQQLLDGPKLADAILICTQDQMHFEPTIKALEKGYHVLLEKPMSNNPEECYVMGEYAKKYDRVFAVCHVLRYNDFFVNVKKLLEGGEIGSLMTIQHLENVGYWHQAHSFVRGNWRNSAESSPMILQKSCHDLDILSWLVGEECTKVSSFGYLSHFKEENAPVGAPQRCTDGCPVRDECAFYAPRFYLIDKNDWQGKYLRSYLTNDTSPEGIMKALREGPYGRCVYHCDNDVVDHQVVNLEFSNQVTASFVMNAFSNLSERIIRLYGTKGEIYGDMDRNVIQVTHFTSGITKEIRIPASDTGHGGGDDGIMKDFVALVQSGEGSHSRSSAVVSVQSHLMAFAAETSRKEQRVIQMSEYVENLRQTTTV